jgi:hypothetical protein
MYPYGDQIKAVRLYLKLDKRLISQKSNRSYPTQ